MGWERGDRVAGDETVVKELEEENVDAQEAFGVLTSELGLALELAQEEGTQAFQQGQFAKAQAAALRAGTIKNHLDNLTSLQENWEDILSRTPQRKPRRRKTKRTHLSPGVKTPDKAFRIPILRALDELGGSGSVSEVLKIVEHMMGDQFNEFDTALLKDGRSLRWRNTAQWERQNMKKEGLLSADSPRGIWEITKAGKAYLQEYKDKTNI
jgi:restriction system protein